MKPLLTCSICQDIFDDPQSLPCMHTFCKGCINEHFRVNKESSCPLCRNPAWKRQLVPNRTLAQMAISFLPLHGNEPSPSKRHQRSPSF